MCGVTQSIGRGVIVALLCVSIGLHWIALQSVAWGVMLVAYSQSCSLREAVAKTFDGKHPCNLCKHVSVAQHAPKKPATVTAAAKPDMICAVTLRSIRNPWKNFEYATFSASICDRTDRPATPRPRQKPA